MVNYLQTPLGINHIANYVSARSPQGLRRAMLSVNKKFKAFIKYQDIQFNPKDGKWYAWYYMPEDIKSLETILAEQDNGNEG